MVYGMQILRENELLEYRWGKDVKCISQHLYVVYIRRY